ncbi:MAG: diguanylate cyclase [Sulfuricurvum sp.]|uniref:diguanylate cyclase n=1 Tax=Sulfuricurvum sp. TaxID=2025608 RepID=UPI00261B78D0|nr:diguanylate cyclase [Sulfuricurvum sp.]MDD2829729.1 diguanylate cyclase [Sulfuricurvum sp.]MDD4949199.1 diguanylate cyclase [Sulfuricurvum sp.]
MDSFSILVVDDEPLNLKLAAQTLKDNYTVLVARSGEEALEYLKTHTVDLILLDIVMNGLSGFEVAEVLRSTSSTSYIPIIYLTSDTNPETIVKAFKTGAVDYITKPFRSEEMSVRVGNRVQTYHLQKELRNALQTNSMLLGVVDKYVAYVKVDLKGMIQNVSESFCTFLQCTKDDLIGKNINILSSSNTAAEVYKNLWETLESGQTYAGDIEDRNFVGGTNWFHVTASPDYDNKGVLNGYIAFYQNIDVQMRYKHDANTDSLTALMNRASLDKILEAEIQRAHRYSYPLSAILIDIDHFKEVNDTYGHQVGDVILKEFAKILSTNIREVDVIGRWGGEEFLIICPHTDAEGAIVIAENLRSCIEEYNFNIVGKKTASFGIAQYDSATLAENLFHQLDRALYCAKDKGRNQVVLYKEQ